MQSLLKLQLGLAAPSILGFSRDSSRDDAHGGQLPTAHTGAASGCFGPLAPPGPLTHLPPRDDPPQDPPDAPDARDVFDARLADEQKLQLMPSRSLSSHTSSRLLRTRSKSAKDN